MEPESGFSSSRSRNILLLCLPVVVILLNVFVWITAVSRSGFWADDFLNVTHFYRTLGDLSNDHINLGKYSVNVFWWLGTEAFGSGSVIPFLLLNSVIFGAGLALWLRAGTESSWTSVDAWWIGGLFIATAAWLPTALWSSNIVHSGGFFALGAGLLAHERCMRSSTFRRSVLWSLSSGAAWTLAIISNLLYIGLLVIAAYCAVHQILKIRRYGMTTLRASVMVGSWSLLIPIVYFAAVAYPGTTANSAYAHNGLRFIHPNLEFYRAGLAPSGLLVAIYIAVLLLGLIGGIAAARRRDWFPLAVLVAAGATALPSLVQAQQRDIHYMAMPLLLVFSALAAGARPVVLGRTKQLVRLRAALLLFALATLFFVFRQGADVRSYFVQSPYGHSLAAFRSEVASLTPESSTICARLDLDATHQSLFSAEMSGQDGFLVAPISAARTYLVPPGKTCPAQASAAHITVSLNARGNFVAAG